LAAQQRSDQVFVFSQEDGMQDERQVLEKELQKVEEQIVKLEAALEEKPDYGLGEGDPAVTNWELNRALLEQLKERQESTKRALSRSDRGAYGVCAQCGQEIHPDRLAVLPDARLCIRCARAKAPAR
jgi:RNA polymerase-binding transcription factor DksA